MSRFLFAFEYINAVKEWTTFAGMRRKPVQVTISFPFVRCNKALDAFYLYYKRLKCRRHRRRRRHRRCRCVP